MAPISPHLDSLLTRWIKRSNDLRKEAVFQKELIEPAALAAFGNRLALRERRQRVLRQAQKSFDDAQLRWHERLQRIEEWKRTVQQLQQEANTVDGIIRSTSWLQKARRYQDAFVRHMEHRVEFLHLEQQSLHEKLTAWLAILEDRDAALANLKEKRERSERTIFVSRARKQPEIEFVIAQKLVADEIRDAMKDLRRSLNHTLARLHKAHAVIERQATGAEIHYVMNKQEMLTALQPLGVLVQTRREEILADALVYERCQYLYRRLQAMVESLQCIEDAPQRRRTPWNKLFSRR